MADIIHLLPDSIANQIAAGEVVQRPASVVKELLENSIDAGANEVQLIVKEAGRTLIQVVDNGCGMSHTDARMCFERHATSKIKKSNDLFSIRTFGFRGEAMASIAAVAQVELKSRKNDEELGTHIVIEGSEIKKQEETACQVGTTTIVKNLFYNVPARRNFLKSNPVELKHIIEEFQRVALAHPEVSFSMFQNDIETFNLPAGKLSQRIVGIFGKSYKEQLIAVDETAGEINITGYIGKPESAKKTRGEQYFFVNNRFIKHNYLNHAVLGGFEGLLAPDSYPFYVLYIEIDPKHIDINVHPTKTEIKFDDERTLYAIMKAAVKKALGVYNVTPSIDFGSNVNFTYKDDSEGAMKAERNMGFEKVERSPREAGNQENWKDLYEGFESQNFKTVNVRDEETQEVKIQSSMNKGGDLDASVHADATITFQIHHKYIITQVKSGMMMIDQQAAHERVLYEKYQGMMDNKFGASQQFLFPQTIELSPSDYALVMGMQDEIKALGFVFNDFGKNTIVVNGIPSDAAGASEKDLFESLVEQFKYNKSELKLDVKENLARSLARRSSLKSGIKLSQEEMKTLIDQLFACSNPNYAPGGNLTYVLLDLNTMEGYFNK